MTSMTLFPVSLLKGQGVVRLLHIFAGSILVCFQTVKSQIGGNSLYELPKKKKEKFKVVIN